MSRAWRTLDPPLSDEVLTVIEDEFKFVKMTPVQAATIPLFLQHKDVSVQACTGSGKTLAFLLPIMEILLRRREPLKKNQVGAMIISPTRELASQIHSVAQRFTNVLSLTLLSLIGGTDVAEDERLLDVDGAQIIVATPGRLKHIMMRGNLDVSGLEVLVLDEADRLLDMGFERAITDIIKRLPRQRRTGLFSATQTQEVKQLVKAGLRNPVSVNVQVKRRKGAEKSQDPNSVIPNTLTNRYVIVSAEDKLNQLVAYLQKVGSTEKVIVFFLTTACVDYFAVTLPALAALRGVAIMALHGKMTPKKRRKLYQAFVAAPAGVLLCTDVAARGIDVSDVTSIVQYDPPQDPAFFVHRVGRTARNGATGDALLYLLPQESAYVDLLAQQRVPLTQSATMPVPNVTEDVKALSLADRAVMIKAQSCYVSYIRAYKEHHCQFIFILKNLPFGKVAEGLGLLFLPRMPDLKHFNIEYKGTHVKSSSIQFKDKKREKQRLENYQALTEKRQKEKKKREKKQLEYQRKKAKQAPKRRAKRKHEEMKAEWEELAEENRLLKRLKKGKITRDQYRQLSDNLGEDDYMPSDASDGGLDGAAGDGSSHPSAMELREEPAVNTATVPPTQKKKTKKKKKNKKTQKQPGAASSGDGSSGVDSSLQAVASSVRAGATVGAGQGVGSSAASATPAGNPPTPTSGSSKAAKKRRKRLAQQARKKQQQQQ